MKKGSVRRKSSLFYSATPDELEVAEILVNLESIMRISNERSAFKEGEAPTVTPLTFYHKTDHCFDKSSENRSGETCIGVMEALTLTANTTTDLLPKELKTCSKKGQPNVEISPRGMNVGMESTQDGITAGTHQQPLIRDPTSQKSRELCYSNPGLGLVNHVGPLGILDLNISPEEAFGIEQPSQPSDIERAIADRRSRFAEARKIMRRLIKIKAMKSACGFGVKVPNASQ